MNKFANLLNASTYAEITEFQKTQSSSKCLMHSRIIILNTQPIFTFAPKLNIVTLTFLTTIVLPCTLGEKQQGTDILGSIIQHIPETNNMLT
jgi:hypothetical protein